MPLQLLQGAQGLVVLAAYKDEGALQVGPTDLQVVVGHRARGQCGNHICAAILEAGEHVGDAAGTLHFKTQAGAQADELQQVGGDAAKMSRAIEIR
ncbi:hypothetical protein D3C80_1091850 [compost metagenome]